MTPDDPRPDADDADDADDAAMLADLARVLDLADPVPAETTLAARSAFAHRALDAEIAALLDADAMELAGTRGAAAATPFTFLVGSVVVDLEVEPEGDVRVVRGQVGPDVPVAVTVRGSTSEIPAQLDALGQFVVRVAPGPFSLRIRWQDRPTALTTEWVVL